MAGQVAARERSSDEPEPESVGVDALLGEALAELARDPSDAGASTPESSLVATAARALGAPVVLLYVVLDAGGLGLAAARGLDPGQAPASAARSTLAARALAERRIQIIELTDGARELVDVRAIAAASASRWAVAAPLGPAGAPDAVVVLGLDRPDEPGRREETILQALSDLLRIARMHERARERDRTLQAAVEAIRSIGDKDRDAAFRELAAHAARVARASYAAVAVLREDGAYDRWLAPGGVVLRAPGVRPLDPRGAEGAIAVDDAAADPRFAALLGEGMPPPGPVLAVPVLLGDAHLADLFVARDRGERPFSPEVTLALRLLAQHAAARLARAPRPTAEPAVAGRHEVRRRVLDRALDLAPVAIGRIAPDGHFLRANARLSTLLGYSPDELRKLRLQDLAESDDRGSLRLPDKDAWRASRRYVRKGGGVVELDVRYCLVRDRAGAPAFVIAHFDDDTAQRRAQLALGAEGRELRALVDNAVEGIVVFDNAMRVLSANPSACALLGAPSASIVGRTLDELSADGADRLSEGFGERGRRLLEEGAQTGRATLTTGTGEPVEVEYGARAHFTPGKHVAILRDVTNRARVEAALRHAQEGLAQAQRLAHVGNWDLDLVEGSATWSDECYRIIGRRPGGRQTQATFLALVHPGDRERVERAVQAAIHDDEPYAIEFRILRDDGETRIVDERGEVLRDREGRPVRMLGAVRDVTDQRDAEDALRRSEERLRIVAASITDVLLQIRIEPTIALEYVSPAIEQLTGHAPTEWYAYPDLLRRIVHPDDRARLDGFRVPRAGDGELPPSTLTLRIVRPDGVVVWIETRVSRMRDPSGVRVVAVARDVTERERSHADREKVLERLAAERTWLRTVIDRSPVGILLAEGPSGDRIVANRRAEELFGKALPPSGGVIQYLGELCDPDGKPLAFSDLPATRAMAGEGTVGRELSIRQPDGRQIPVLVSTAPIRVEGGGNAGAVIVFEDISLLKDLERLREEWTSLVAHDLRQPLTAIAAYAALLARRPEDSAMKARAEHILASAHLLSRMVGDLLEASRIESRHLELLVRPVSLETLVRGAVERFAEHEKPVQLSIERELPELCVDPDRVEQVLSNLLANAVRHGDAEPAIEVTVGRREREVEIAVQNAGPGIPAQELGQLFQRFGRARERRPGSLGLGLYISKGIVEAHGGRIWAESTPDQTTTFRFTLPLERPPAKT